MLLTGSQISMTISSCIVFIFTSLLFLSGYILQQQTVHNLQKAIRPPQRHSPRTPISTTSRSLATPTSAPVSSPIPTIGDSNDLLPALPWASVAYAQTVELHEDVCNAVMLFAELQRQGSKARRVLLFPQHWSEDSDDSSGSKAADTASERQISTTRRLLRIAARRYNVVLRPLLLDSTEAQETNPQPDRDLLAMSHLTQYSQIISLLGPGLLLDSDPLDRLLSTPMPAKSTLQTIRPQEDSPSHEIPLFLLKPSRETFTALNSPPEINEQQQTPMLSHHKPMIPEHIDSDYFRTHILTTSDLPLHNVSLAVSTASYIHVSSSFSRSEPGPEYDIPSKIWSSMGPSRGQRERRSVWEGIYERFRDTRMSVCGLDLEPWPKNQNL